MVVTALTVVLAAAPPTGFTTAIERVAMVKTGGPVAFEYDSLSAHITVKGLKLADGAAHALCPKTEIKRGALVFTCTSRRVWASLEEDKLGSYLDVRQLRGTVPSDTTLLLRPWPLKALSIPESCPGTQPGPRAECALADGDLTASKKAFLEAMGGADTNLARIRLGDMALRDGNMEEALSRYSKVSFAGPIGRMAKSRACDLTGACDTGIDADDIADTTGLPEPLKTEFELYMMRRFVVTNRVPAAMDYFARRLTQAPSLCDNATNLCQHFALAGLEDPDEATRANALSAYMSDEVRYGPLKNELALAASAAAERLGAPAFAAALLSSLSPTVPIAELDAHLLRVAQLFLAGRDRIRMDFILEYADGRLGRRTSKAWQAIRYAAKAGSITAASVTAAKAERRVVDFNKLSSDVELSTELARAAAIRSRAVANRNEGKSQ